MERCQLVDLLTPPSHQEDEGGSKEDREEGIRVLDREQEGIQCQAQAMSPTKAMSTRLAKMATTALLGNLRRISLAEAKRGARKV